MISILLRLFLEHIIVSFLWTDSLVFRQSELYHGIESFMVHLD